MPRLSKVALLLVVMLAVSIGALAQTPTPNPEMKNFQPGEWVYQEEVRSTPDGPWEKGSWTIEHRWIGSFFEGRFSGRYSGTEFYGFDPAQKTRFYIGFSQTSELSRGTWEWPTERTLTLQGTTVAADGRPVPWRCTWEVGDARSPLGTCERLTEGKWWVFRKAKGTKQ